jgi:hypothetical protein
MQRISILIKVLAIVLIVNGCRDSLQSQPIEIGGLIVRNQTAGPLYDIKLKVERTGTVVTCNFIPAGGDFSTEFPLRRYQGNSVQISWQQNGRAFATGELYAEIPTKLTPDKSATVIVDIHNNGIAVIRLKQ